MRRIPAGEDRDLVAARDREVVAAVVVEVPDRDRPRDGSRADAERPLEAAVPPPGEHRQDRSRGVRKDDVDVSVLRCVGHGHRYRRPGERDLGRTSEHGGRGEWDEEQPGRKSGGSD